jgi:hypothetical protein
MMAGSRLAAPIQVEPGQPAVDQLWNEVSGIIDTVNSWMVPFLKLFGIEDGNDLSPFIQTFNPPEHISLVIQQFFCPPKSR